MIDSLKSKKEGGRITDLLVNILTVRLPSLIDSDAETKGSDYTIMSINCADEQFIKVRFRLVGLPSEYTWYFRK